MHATLDGNRASKQGDDIGLTKSVKRGGQVGEPMLDDFADHRPEFGKRTGGETGGNDPTHRGVLFAAIEEQRIAEQFGQRGFPANQRFRWAETLWPDRH